MRRLSARGVMRGLAIAAFCGYRIAHAEGAPNPPIAQALFEEGRSLMGAGKYEKACGKLAESQRLDPASGTLLNLAVCHESMGKTATAWAEYNDVLAISRREGNAERLQIATDRLRALEPRLCHLSIVPTSGVAADELLVAIDGVDLGSAALRTAVPVDPGTHAVVVQRRGTLVWSGTIAVSGDGTATIVAVPEPAPAVSDLATKGRNQERQLLTVLSGASAAASFGLGVFFGLGAKSEWNERNAHCPGNACDAEAVTASRAAHRLAFAADVCFGLGVVGASLATYFALTTSGPAPSSVGLAVRASPHGSYAFAEGHF